MTTGAGISSERAPHYALDHVLFEGVSSPLAERPPRAAARQLREPSPPPEQPPDPFVVWLLQACGLDPAAYRARPLNRRLHAVLRGLSVTDVGEARTLLEQRPDLLPTALAALLIAVTAFARDERVFEAVKLQALPRLVEREGGLRVWSAGCADGEELFTVALLLAEAGLLERAELLGTDCRRDVILRASLACYPDHDLAPLPGALRDRYFAGTADGRHPVREVTSRVGWKVADLTCMVEKGPWDIILCRNLAIYLRREAGERLWRSLAGELREGGFLVTGKAEHPACPGLVRIGPSLYRKVVTA